MGRGPDQNHKSRRHAAPAPGGEEGINTVTRQRTEEVVILKREPCPDSLPAMPSPPKSIRASKLHPTLSSEATVRPMAPWFGVRVIADEVGPVRITCLARPRTVAQAFQPAGVGLNVGAQSEAAG